MEKFIEAMLSFLGYFTRDLLADYIEIKANNKKQKYVSAGKFTKIFIGAFLFLLSILSFFFILKVKSIFNWVFLCAFLLLVFSLVNLFFIFTKIEYDNLEITVTRFGFIKNTYLTKELSKVKKMKFFDTYLVVIEKNSFYFSLGYSGSDKFLKFLKKKIKKLKKN